ncbi:MAG: 6-carboxytetrahydropterin synthase [Gemmatimonadales bacterium]|jgi:6-pyruvoyltetrahydropterin/6-carboxytetrahydropterin synthase|nr:6-carboxytetrahydropterin synthase [Gemmatimonadales bacterium]
MGTSLTRTIGFRALHRFYRPEWTEAHNREVFGPLSEPPGHAHEYRCAVTVSGPIDATMAMVVDLPLLDRILQDEVLIPFDGKHLNLDVPAFAYGRALPTCEAIAAYVYPRVAARLPGGVLLERVRIMEDPTLYADCTGIP